MEQIIYNIVVTCYIYKLPLKNIHMESNVMAGLDHTTLKTSEIPMHTNMSIVLLQLLIVSAIFTWLKIAKFTTLTKHLRAQLQPFVLQYVENGVPIIIAIQVLSIC